MKNAKHIATILAFIIAVIVCLDDSIASVSCLYSSEIPVQSGQSAESHHHHISINDHFFCRKFIGLPFTESAISIKLSITDQRVASQFHTAIFQPPKIA
jgi:hypothetical protein